jgi:ATP-binding cassette subfamily C protein LapB
MQESDGSTADVGTPAAAPRTIAARRDPLLECLVFVARHHGRQVSRAGLTAGLPLEARRLSPSLFARAAERAGLEARIVETPLDDLAATAFPVVLLLRDSAACVLLARDEAGLHIVEPGEPAKVVEPLALAPRYSGSAILLRTGFEFDERAPEMHQHRKDHWFWGAMHDNLPLYRDVLLAAGMVNVFALGLPIFTMNVYDRVVPNHALETLWMLAAGLLIVLCADFALRSMRGYFLDLASKRIDVRVSSFIMERVLGLRMEERPASAGSFAANLRSFESVRDFITSATVTAVVDMPFALLFLVVIGWIAWPMLIPVILAMLIVVTYAIAVGSRMHALAETTYRAGAMRNATLIESLVGLETVKALGAEGVMQQRWERSASFLAQTGAQLRLLATSTVNTALLAQQLTAVAVIVLGVYLITDARLSMGGLIACSMLTARALAPMGQVAGLMTQYHNAITALAALEQIVEKPVERPVGAHFLSRRSFRGDIEFRDVAFSYPGTEQNALRGVSFRITAGEKVAILGRTGSGKSTLLRLMMGLYRPISGAVLIDGIDLRQLDPGELRRSIGYVPQDVMLFFGTLRENITIGAQYAEDADIVRAMHVGNIAEFVNLHPKGIDMPVGERGESLSGGQREGVAIARAVISQPPILLMDEPTGSMDHSSEESIKARLREFSTDRTVVVVTHRTSLLDIVDRIIVTDQGKIVADGPKATVVEALRQGRIGKGT